MRLPFAIALACVLWGCSLARSPMAPSLQTLSTLERVGGSSSVRREASAPVVMVHFMSSWCGQCLFELPHIVSLRRSIQSGELGIIAVAIDDTESDARSVAERTQLPFPLLLDRDGVAKELFSIRTLPTTLFISSDGAPVAILDAHTRSTTNRFEGAYEWDRGPARAQIQAALDARD